MGSGSGLGLGLGLGLGYEFESRAGTAAFCEATAIAPRALEG